MKKLFYTFMLIIVACMMSTHVLAQDTSTSCGRPKLLVGIAVDQMRWDYLYRYYDLYGKGGFKRMMNEGFNFENVQINYIPSITAVGHSALYTGSVPSINGIAGNNFYVDGKFTYCTEDHNYKTVGSKTTAGEMSPNNLLTTTIGDELKIATNYQARVIGVSIKDRAAILPAGHSADAAYWVDGKEHCFISSTYYMDKLPEWVEKFNKKVMKKHTSDEINYTGVGNEITAEMSKAAITHEKLGHGETTDMIAISFSTTDKLGHAVGTHSDKIRDLYVDLDKRLEDLFDYLDNTIGKGEYMVFLSADHGAANGIVQNQQHKVPAGGFNANNVSKEINAWLSAQFGGSQPLVERIMDYKICFNRDAVKSTGKSLEEIKSALIPHLKEDAQYAYVVDLENVNASTVPCVIREKIINGYNRLRGGDIQLILQPAHYGVGDKIDAGTTHGVWNPYDAHLPFLLMGKGVTHGASQTKASINDIAATVCALIHIQMPNGCIGNPLTPLTK